MEHFVCFSFDNFGYRNNVIAVNTYLRKINIPITKTPNIHWGFATSHGLVNIEVVKPSAYKRAVLGNGAGSLEFTFVPAKPTAIKIHKKKLIYDGSADSVREYIHVSDAAKTSVDILSSEYKNQTLVLTGQEPMRISDLLKTIAEILNKNYKIIFKKKKNISGHYNLSPYSYDEDVNLKLRRNSYIDMGQGLIQLVNFIKDKNK